MDKIETKSKINEDGTVEFSSLYEINKQGYSKVLPYNEENLVNSLNEVHEWFRDNNINYAMMLCKELSDYTVFDFTHGMDKKEAADVELRNCLKNRGLILDIVYKEDVGAFEIWLKINDEVYMYYLFECEDFIIYEVIK